MIGLKWLTGLALGMLFWTYVGYPLLMLLLARWRPRPVRVADFTPNVTLIIPAYNEEKYIAARIENALALDYPPEQLHIIVVADGSTDATPILVQAYAERGVQVLYQPARRGKIAAMNRAVAYATGEILAFSDANTFLEPGSLRTLLRNFADPQVGCVSGAKHVRPDVQVQARGESLYWRYEALLKTAESRTGSSSGAVGEFFAVRRSLYRTLEEDIILDDFVLSMRLALEGWRVLYEAQAVAWETASPSLSAEWERRARNIAGGFQALGRLRALFSWRHLPFALQFTSHKILRWTAWLWMAVAWLGSALLNALPLYRFLFLAQTLFYLLAFLGYLLERSGRPWRPLQVIFYFTFGNLTGLAGFWRHLTRRQSSLWKKVR